MSETVRDGDWEWFVVGYDKGAPLYARRPWRTRPYPHALPYTQAEIDALGLDKEAVKP